MPMQSPWFHLWHVAKYCLAHRTGGGWGWGWGFQNLRTNSAHRLRRDKRKNHALAWNELYKSQSDHVSSQVNRESTLDFNLSLCLTYQQVILHSPMPYVIRAWWTSSTGKEAILGRPPNSWRPPPAGGMRHSCFSHW